MCGIAGALLRAKPADEDVGRVRRMVHSLSHRGPDAAGIAVAGQAVLGAARLAIVDVANGTQPFGNDHGTIRVVYNGEIYNHGALRERVLRRGHVLKSASDGAVIAPLYQEYGSDCFSLLQGQFAIAIADRRSNTLVLARDALGICPLHWIETPAGLYFCSEAKGLIGAGVAPRAVEPRAILQMSYFGTVCAPLTAFAGVRQLQPGHFLAATTERSPHPRRYWSLQFPRRGEHADLTEAQAVDGLQTRLEAAVRSHTQGEFPATCFLSGGIDSAVIGALLQRDAAPAQVTAFCAAAEDAKIDEGTAAASTASRLGLQLQSLPTSEALIAGAFPRLIWHAEVPVNSTEAAALMLLAARVRPHSKIVLTGEGSDEAFGGYLAFRQHKLLGPLATRGLLPLRALVRPLLQRHYGSSCLLPAEARLQALRDCLGCFPAQAYEWEFYREAITPVLSTHYREILLAEQQWDGFEFDRAAIRGRHALDRSLYVGYQVMLPNYLLGAHGDRIFAANSVEGRYPFLARDLVEYCASLPPSMKLRGLGDKYVLRQAAKKWLPDDITRRRKRRFVMPFGTPFLGPRAPAFYAELLSPATISAYGYFDPLAVKRLLLALTAPPQPRGGARAYLERLALGLAATLVVSTQLWHQLYIAGSRDSLYADRPMAGGETAAA